MRPGAGQRLAGIVSWLDASPPWFSAALLMVLTLALYGHSTSGSWTYDDPLILKQVILHSPAEYFFVPHAWQELTAASFSPLLTLSYELDYTLFGLSPAAFYGHQLVSVALAAFAFHLLLTLWVPRSFAILGAILLLLSAPMALASAWLAIRHYVEGLALALLAMAAWVLALRGNGRVHGWVWVSTGLYLLAMLAKEVYVPFAGLALLLPERTWRERLRAGWPLWAALALYLVWRVWMLGGRFGGYGLLSVNWENAPGILSLRFLLLPLTYFFSLLGVNSALPLWLGIFGASVVLWVRHQGLQALGLAVGVFLIVSLPLLPVISDLKPDTHPVALRFIAVPSTAILFALVVGLARLVSDQRSRLVALLVLGIFGLGLGAKTPSMRTVWDDPPRHEREAKFLLEGDSASEALSVSKAEQSFLYRGLYWLRGYLGPGEAPAVAYGGYFLLSETASPETSSLQFYRYDLRCNCLQEVTKQVQLERRRILDRLAGRPLRASLHWGSGWLGWSLGPYDEGQYFLLSGERPDWYSSRRYVRRQGSYTYFMEGYMRVGYESPEGWIAISPEFRVDLTRPGRFDWSADEPRATLDR